MKGTTKPATALYAYTTPIRLPPIAFVCVIDSFYVNVFPTLWPAAPEKKNRNVGRYPIYFSCGLFCPPPPLLLVAGIVQFF
jgi:hypothetical protein